MAITPEGKVKEKLKTYCKEHNILLIPYPQNGYGVVGFPDYILLKSGKVLFVEVKAARGKASPMQLKMGVLLQAEGFNWIIFKGKDECFQKLEELING